MKNSTLCLLALWLLPGLGPKTIQKLLHHFSNPEDIFNSTSTILQNKIGISHTLAKTISEIDVSQFTLEEQNNLQKIGIDLTSILDSDYPLSLSEIYNPPPILYVKGNLHSSLNKFMIAVVGSRKTSYYGKKQTQRIIQEIAEKQPNAIIISGLALGIDTIAHETAMDCKLKTIAVLAGGLNSIYPSQNQFLSEQIVEQGGALITEFPIMSKPVAGNFPLRNRIISGLSKATLVMEAGKKSGALITAEYAFEQNRTVFALPGVVDSSYYQGTNKLIQKGVAQLLMNGDDVLNECDLNACDLRTSSKQTSFFNEEIQNTNNLCTQIQSDILSFLEGQSMTIDQLARETKLSTHHLVAEITKMELKKIVINHSGMISKI